jgi:hypothetical protein
VIEHQDGADRHGAEHALPHAPQVDHQQQAARATRQV